MKNKKHLVVDTDNFTFSDESAKTKVVQAVQRADVEVKRPATNKKYIVASVVEGAPIVLNFLEAMEYYAKVNNAQVILLWMRGVYKGDRFSLTELDRVKPYLTSEIRFNTKLIAKAFLIHPAQKYPVAGLEEYAQDNDSIICASTKQCLQVVARPKGKVPHTIHTTGTISKPKYSKTRVGCIAEQDNKLGALVVEVKDSKNFFIRQVQWIDNGFVDLGIKYTKNAHTQVSCEAMVLGDLHLTEEDPVAIKSTYDQLHFFNPKNIFIHDVLSNNSINHHEKENCVFKCTLPEKFDSLEKELEYGKFKLTELRNKVNKGANIFIVPSNHDDFIRKFCNDGMFIKDPKNAVIGAKCFIALVDKKNPLDVYCHVDGITYLPKDSTYKIEGWELAEHGHLGTNGARGSAKSFMKSHNKVIIGHSHTPKIIGNVWQVGTLSKLSLSYTSGASSWMHANCVVYEGGYTQMILFITGDWHVDSKNTQR
jgi:hypothetical protein